MEEEGEEDGPPVMTEREGGREGGEPAESGSNAAICRLRTPRPAPDPLLSLNPSNPHPTPHAIPKGGSQRTSVTTCFWRATLLHADTRLYTHTYAHAHLHLSRTAHLRPCGPVLSASAHKPTRNPFPPLPH